MSAALTFLLIPAVLAAVGFVVYRFAVSPAVRAVFWRTFASYFTGVLGYLFIVAFCVAASVRAFNEEFFAANLATLDRLSAGFPVLLLFLIPAITMTAWSDERKTGTDELLFTLPVREGDVLLGKYLAVLSVYTVALLFSLTNLAVLWALGSPDPGPVFATYLGYWLVGAALCAAGLFCSALTGSPAVAFVLGGDRVQRAGVRRRAAGQRLRRRPAPRVPDGPERAGTTPGLHAGARAALRGGLLRVRGGVLPVPELHRDPPPAVGRAAGRDGVPVRRAGGEPGGGAGRAERARRPHRRAGRPHGRGPLHPLPGHETGAGRGERRAAGDDPGVSLAGGPARLRGRAEATGRPAAGVRPPRRGRGDGAGRGRGPVRRVRPGRRRPRRRAAGRGHHPRRPRRDRIGLLRLRRAGAGGRGGRPVRGARHRGGVRADPQRADGLRRGAADARRAADRRRPHRAGRELAGRRRTGTAVRGGGRLPRRPDRPRRRGEVRRAAGGRPVESGGGAGREPGGLPRDRPAGADLRRPVPRAAEPAARGDLRRPPPAEAAAGRDDGDVQPAARHPQSRRRETHRRAGRPRAGMAVRRGRLGRVQPVPGVRAAGLRGVPVRPRPGGHGGRGGEPGQPRHRRAGPVPADLRRRRRPRRGGGRRLHAAAEDRGRRAG